MPFEFTSISNYHSALQAGETSAEEAVLHYLTAIEQNRHLNAMVAIFSAEAIAVAKELDSSLANGNPLLPLQGLVVAIKEVICIKNQPISAASAMLSHHKALYDATVVKRLKQAGAIIIGTCNCDEFAMGSTNENSVYGPVKNAANIEHVSGGSSGGSAVAVQAGLCMLSLGSDTGGSVRQPADFCGVWGLKPGYGVVSRYGLIAYASSFDCIGMFGTNANDLELVLKIIAGADGKDGTCPLSSQHLFASKQQLPGKPLSLAVLEPTLRLPGLDGEIKKHLEAGFEQLVAHGHSVDQVPFDLLDYVVPAYYVLTTAEASSNLARYDGIRYGHRTAASNTEKIDLTAFYSTNRSAGFGKEVKRRIMLGSFVLSSGYYDAYFAKAQQVRAQLVAIANQIMEEYDAILMPVSPVTAFKIGEKIKDPVSMYLADIYTVFANLTGMAGVAFPLFTHSNGLPFGLQALTKAGDELNLLRISNQLHQIIGAK